MIILSHRRRYLPHEVITREKSVELAHAGEELQVIVRRYKISRSSLWRWRKRFDGTSQSLIDRSHRPKSRHPNAHSDVELKWIGDLRRRNPHHSYLELWVKLKRNKGYKRHPVSLYRILVKDFHYERKPLVTYKPQPYDTPVSIGEKWQMDTKYVPKICKSTKTPSDKKFYQYTVIDEADRKRFLYWYDDISTNNTVDFVIRAINYFGYIPKIIQTDSGLEYTNTARKRRMKEHPLDALCQKLGIVHQLIRPRTPRHNGKVERSHRNDNQRFYQYLKFYDLNDLRIQGSRYLKRSNDTPMSVLYYKTPNEVEAEQLATL
jgi:transposase InsO family protein